MPDQENPGVEINILVPIRTLEVVTAQVKKEGLGIFFPRKDNPDDVRLLYKPYYRTGVSYTLDPVLGREHSGECEVIVDGLSGIGAVLKRGSEIRTEQREVPQAMVVDFQVTVPEGVKIAVDNVVKMVYRKYQRFPKCINSEPEVFFRAFYVLQWTKGRRRKEIVAADPFELRGK